MAENVLSRQARPPALDGARLGMLIFLAAEAMLFAGFVAAFLVLRLEARAWPPPLQPRLPPGVSGLNTLVLLASGWTMLRAKRRARAGARARATGALALTALLGAAFLGAQGAEWARLLRFGLSAPSGIYGGMFYAVVGAHAAHVLGALLWLLAVLCIGPLRRGAVAGGDGLSLLSLYWCFVVALWPFLYALLYLA